MTLTQTKQNKQLKEKNAALEGDVQKQKKAIEEKDAEIILQKKKIEELEAQVKDLEKDREEQIKKLNGTIKSLQSLSFALLIICLFCLLYYFQSVN